MRLAEKELHGDLVILEMQDYDVILGMDFLSKYNGTVFYRGRQVAFQPNEKQRFIFVGESKKKPKVMISALRAQKMLANGAKVS